MTNTVSAAGEAMPSAKLSRRALLAGAAASLPVATAGTAMAAQPALKMSPQFLALLEKHENAVQADRAASAYLEAIKDRFQAAEDARNEFVPIAYRGSEPEGDGYERSRYLSYQIREAIQRRHDELRRIHCGPSASLMSPDGAAKMKVAIDRSETKALEGWSAPAQHTMPVSKPRA
ncbi:hypothetical protein [Terrihabitans sp. B22-R8]|uniref:hypothetical protein n=1 Tax=Terrihabitans sp. B22-R8 TaxID=3425128 RepID=UPI00403D3611